MEIQTVTGRVPASTIGLADAHAHAWIAPPVGVSGDARIELDDYGMIQAGLAVFGAAGGSLLVDCQPGGAGRDANRLRELSQATGVAITATTGFHRSIYYAPDNWLWAADEAAAAAFFLAELTNHVAEGDADLRATTVKIGYEGVIDGPARVLMEAAADAARQTGALLLAHTEEGRNVEALLPFFETRGVPAERLYFCHMDKRPDLGLHRELAQAGVLLGYDTFARPQYRPEDGVWKLIPALVGDGWADHLALGLDLARPSLWTSFGGQPGLEYLPQVVVPRLRHEGLPEPVIARLTGGNVAARLAWHVPT